MTRICALLAITVLIVACGKYGPPKRIRPQPAASPAVELEAEGALPEATGSAAQPETGTQPREPDENQENGP